MLSNSALPVRPCCARMASRCSFVHCAQLVELRVREVLVLDAVVADHQALARHGRLHDAIAHDRVQRLALGLGGVQQLQVGLRIA